MRTSPFWLKMKIPEIILERRGATECAGRADGAGELTGVRKGTTDEEIRAGPSNRQQIPNFRHRFCLEGKT